MFTKKKPAIRAMKTSAGTDVTTRKDIGCGFIGCPTCSKVEGGLAPVLSAASDLMIPDTNVILHNINVIEDPRAVNIVLLSTVMEEVQNRNKAIYARLQRIMDSKDKRCYVFANNRHEQTHCLRNKDETPNDYNDRSIGVTAQWYARHVTAFSPEKPLRVFLVTHDKGFQQRMAESEETNKLSNFFCVNMRTFVTETVSTESDLLEKIQYIIPEGMKESNRSGNLFQEHLPIAAMEAGLDNGTYFKGKLRVSDSSCFFGEIRGKFEGHRFERILLPGRANLNRAFHNDVVVVELLPVSEWRGPKKSSAPLDTEEEALAAGFAPLGRVVGILNMARRPYCGSIDVDEFKNMQTGLSGNVSLLFQPKDNRIPRIRLTTRHAADLGDKRIVVVVDDWPVYSSYPVGHYVEVLGTIGDRDTEATVILLENDIPHYDFSEAVYDCLPKGEWRVTDDEVQKRLDLRDLCVVSVDPLGCRDIDDALHCRRLTNNHLEVGVHIADVTHFLHEDTPMDVEAEKRSTSVYLVDRRINMLPQLLTENLCSLVEAEDRYAFSILWEFDENYNVVRDWFGKTIIRSRGALYYGDAQKMIDNAEDHSDVAVSLKHLMRISKHFKEQREKNGALFLASQEFKFTGKDVDNSHLNATDMQAYQTFEANSMIEEWMLYANVAAAQKVYDNYPRWTLLRRHQRPGEGAFDTLNEAIEKKLHMKLDDTTSLSLNQSLNRCVDPADPYFNTLIRILTTRCLRQAQYFCSSDIPKEEFCHFGLAMPIYTHFTSPIRRFADVIVHRQLAAAIGISAVSEKQMDTAKMEAVAENINYRHEQAQRAGRDSQNLFTGFYLRGRSADGGGIQDESGYVVRLSETHVFVLVPKYGQESRIAKEDLQVVPELLQRVTVQIEFKRSGDVMRTKLVFTLKGLMREGGVGGTLDVDEEAVTLQGEARDDASITTMDEPAKKLKTE